MEKLKKPMFSLCRFHNQGCSIFTSYYSKIAWCSVTPVLFPLLFLEYLFPRGISVVLLLHTAVQCSAVQCIIYFTLPSHNLCTKHKPLSLTASSTNVNLCIRTCIHLLLHAWVSCSSVSNNILICFSISAFLLTWQETLSYCLNFYSCFLVKISFWIS